MQAHFIGFFLHLACMFKPKYGLCKGKVLLYCCFLGFFCVKSYLFITGKQNNLIKQHSVGYEKTLNSCVFVGHV